jgi:hypothetical protein
MSRRFPKGVLRAIEPEPIEFGEKHLTKHDWRVGKHKP